MLTLYRMFDANDVLLYVGLSVHPFRRLAQHKGGVSPVDWHEVHNVTFDHIADDEEAIEAEQAAIRDEQPKYNFSQGVRWYSAHKRASFAVRHQSERKSGNQSWHEVQHNQDEVALSD